MTRPGAGIEFFYAEDPRARRLQEDYVRKVLDTLNDLDNVFYEAANEVYAPQWRYGMIQRSSRNDASSIGLHGGGGERSRLGGGERR